MKKEKEILEVKHKRLLKMNPPQIMLAGFAGVILIGALLLYTPIASYRDGSMPFLDCLFTSTSAVCVTGLAIADTGTTWTVFGKVVIMMLIQTGGLGFMSIGAGVAVALRRKINIRQRLLIKESVNVTTVAGIIRLLKAIIRYTLVIEITGACILCIQFIPEFGVIKGIAMSFFHAVSAFCNAGFDLFGSYHGPYTSVAAYFDSPIVVFTISGLIIAGGIGFGVLYTLFENKQIKAFDLTSSVAIRVTIVLISLGTFFILLDEWFNYDSIGNMNVWQKFQVGFFQSVTTRTAGFATMDLTLFRESSLFFMIILMFIGASPSSTGGGIKTTTVAVVYAAVKAFVKNEKEIVIRKRTVGIEMLQKSLGVLAMGITECSIGTWLISLTQRGNFSILESGFEAVSAFATVGLSIGGTPNLNSAGKIIVMLLMYSGRVGTLTLLTLFLRRGRKNNIRLPEGRINIG